MNVAIHQPQYLPWLPYFLKIDESDTFIFLDNVAFQKNGVQNRNQIKTAQGRQWLTVPVIQRVGQEIREVLIDERSDWRRKHWKTILQNYGRAHAFPQYQNRLEEIFARSWKNLSELNIELITMMLKWMGIRTRLIRSSEMKATGTASDLVLNLCLEVGATRYISGTGGSYLLEDAFAEAGVQVVVRQPFLPNTYPQQFARQGFINDISALDIILNCGENWRNYTQREGLKE